MALHLKSRDSVIQAMKEFDRLGREEFLLKYGFGKARSYFLRYRGNSYDSKAIFGVAYGYENPDSGPLRAEQFGGGKKTVCPVLDKLGFDVTEETPPISDTVPERVSDASLLVAFRPRSREAGEGTGPSSQRHSRRAKEIGDRAEEIIYNALIEEYSPDKVDWTARRGKKPGWDIQVVDGDNELLIEVKGTTASKFNSIEISDNEWKAARKHQRSYRLALVTNVLSKNPRYEFIDDPFGLSLGETVEAQPSSWRLVWLEP